MIILKKLIFAPLFLVIFGLLLNQIKPDLESYDLVFSLTLANLFRFLLFALLTLLSAFTFILFASFAFDLKIVVPVIILASLLPFIFFPQSLSIVFLVGIAVALFLIYLTLENTLKTYVTFSPSSILGPPIRNLSFLLIIVLSLAYYLSINSLIQKNGFQIPDSLIESSLQFIPKSVIPQQPEAEQPKIQISKEQIELLRENPKLLEQYGLDPGFLDTIDQTNGGPKTVPQITEELLRQTLKDQLDKVIKPYINFIPIILAFLLFITLLSFTSFLNIFIYPFLELIFYILEKIGFVKFTTEMRPVKKMVV